MNPELFVVWPPLVRWAVVICFDAFFLWLSFPALMAESQARPGRWR